MEAERSHEDGLHAVLGDYRIQEELGGRGGSQVFRAVGHDQSSMVAIKVFPASVAENRRAIEQLLQSLRTVARIDQRGIPRMISSGMVAGRPYIVMPFFPSGSLRDRLEMGLMSLANLESALTEIAAILGCAHSHGVVHGDLRPSEILFDTDGQMQIIGLGQALHRPAQLDSGPQPADEVYRAPEGLHGQAPTSMSDQYSLAVIALEIATGVDAGSALRSMQAGEVDGPYYATRQDRSRPSLPPRMIQVLRRAVADDPGQRFPSLADMERALLAAMHGTPLPAAEPPSENAASEPPRRKRRSWIAIPATALVLVLCFAVTIPAMSSSNLGGFDLGHYTGLLVEALSRKDGQASEPVTAPASSINGTDPDSSADSTALGGDPPTSSNLEGGTPPTGSPSSPADAADAPASTPQSADAEHDSDALPADIPVDPGPTSTIGPVNTPTPLPTSTWVPTSAPSATPVPVLTTGVPPTEPAEGTINPNKCKSDPGHKNYCTPVP